MRSRSDAQTNAPGPLRALAQQHWLELLAIYGLFGLESIVQVTQPFVLGLAIDGLLEHSTFGLIVFSGQQLCVLALGTVRRVFDTRLFTQLASNLASRVVIEQRQSGIDMSQVSARALLSRQLVDFFERDLPFVFHCTIQGIGAIVMLTLAAPKLLPYCLLATIVAAIFSFVYGRFAQQWNQNLHDELERTLGVVTTGSATTVTEHYKTLAHMQIHLSDAEAIFFGSWQLLSLALTVLVVVQSSSDIKNVGQITAVLGYLQMLLTILVNMPRIIDQITRLYDVCRRIDIADIPHTKNYDKLIS